MTTIENNQLSLFDNQQVQSAAVSTAATATDSTESGAATGCDSQLIQFIEKHKDRIWPNEKTRQNTVSRIHRFDAHGDHSQLALEDITTIHIYDWLDSEKRTPRSKKGDAGHPKFPSDATINRYASAISSALTFAAEARLIKGAPKLRYTKEFARERYMTNAEIDMLITFFRNRGQDWMADMVYVGVNTGMRHSEILALGWVNCGRNSSWGEAQVNHDHVYLPPRITKNNEGRRVSINPDVRDACHRLQKSIGTHFTHRKFYDAWNEARHHIAPGDRDFVFHCLRHTCASRMANELKMNTVIIAKQLGHKSTNITMRYVHEKPDAMASFAVDMNVGSGAM